MMEECTDPSERELLSEKVDLLLEVSFKDIWEGFKKILRKIKQSFDIFINKLKLKFSKKNYMQNYINYKISKIIAMKDLDKNEAINSYLTNDLNNKDIFLLYFNIENYIDKNKDLNSLINIQNKYYNIVTNTMNNEFDLSKFKKELTDSMPFTPEYIEIACNDGIILSDTNYIYDRIYGKLNKEYYNEKMIYNNIFNLLNKIKKQTKSKSIQDNIDLVYRMFMSIISSEEEKINDIIKNKNNTIDENEINITKITISKLKNIKDLFSILCKISVEQEIIVFEILSDLSKILNLKYY